MKKYFLIITFFVTNILFISAQSSIDFQFIKKVKGDFVTFSVDQFENIYTLTSTGQLKKIDANGDSVAVFNSLSKFGKVSQVDVSNPLQILVFYKDFSTLLILDRHLSVRNTIDLRKQNIFQVQAACLSYDKKIWLYDDLENKLKKINEDGKLLLETVDFRHLFDGAYSFQSIFESNELVYLYDIKKGLFVFDVYGALKNKIAIIDWENFVVEKDFLLGTKNDSLLRYRISTLSFYEQKLPLSFRHATLIRFMASKLFVLKKEGIEIFVMK